MKGSAANSRKNLRPNLKGRPRLTPEKRLEIKIEQDARTLAREHTVEAIQTLVDVNLNSESDPARVAAANSLLDRGWDKPSQAHQHTGEIVHQLKRVVLDECASSN